MKRIRDPRDFWAGVLFVAVGLFAVLFGRRYSFGTSAVMGPGYFPSVLGWILVGLGLIIGGRALRPRKRLASFGAVRFQPLVIVLAAVVAFGFALPRLGLVIASMVLVTVSRTAAAGFKWGEVVGFAAVLTLFCTAVFVWGLGMPMVLWPPFLLGE
jgi:hypothetical protein